MAFDSINHVILLDDLSRMGLKCTVLQYLYSLNVRAQTLVLWNFSIIPWLLIYGVLQGSVMFTRLFYIYMKPLGEIILGIALELGVINAPMESNTFSSFLLKSKEAVFV